MNEKLEFEIREIYSRLRKSEKKTAEYLIHYQGSYKELTLEKIAREAEVSQPTVLRFIRALGYDGFKDFRYVLAQDQENEENSGNHILYGFRFSENDKVSQVPGQVIGTVIGQLKDTLKSISPEILEKVVQSIIQADKIVLYYVENSSCTANDLVTKLMYLGMNCCAYSDYYVQQVSARNLTEKDLAIGISYSGRSRSTVDAMRLASQAGARTIAITNFENSLIQKYADMVLCTSNEQFLYGDAIFSRVSQLAVVDMIYSGILLSDYEKYTKILDRNSKLIRNQAYSE